MLPLGHLQLHLSCSLSDVVLLDVTNSHTRSNYPYIHNVGCLRRLQAQAAVNLLKILRASATLHNLGTPDRCCPMSWFGVQVLVRLVSSSVNPVDCQIRSGVILKRWGLTQAYPKVRDTISVWTDYSLRVLFHF